MSCVLIIIILSRLIILLFFLIMAPVLHFITTKGRTRRSLQPIAATVASCIHYQAVRLWHYSVFRPYFDLEILKVKIASYKVFFPACKWKVANSNRMDKEKVKKK